MKKTLLVIMLMVALVLLIPKNGMNVRKDVSNKIVNSLNFQDEGVDYNNSRKYDITVLVEVNYEPDAIQKVPVRSEEELEMQRSIVKEYFQDNNESIADKLELNCYDYDVSYYSPFIEIVFDDLSEYKERKDDLISLLSSSIDVNSISINYIGTDEADVNSSACTSDYLLANAKLDIGVGSLSYTGNGVKVGTIESGSPDSIVNLKSGKYTTIATNTSSHCTWVTSIIGGTTGIAEDVYFYCAGISGSSFTTRINDLISTYGVHIINMSYGMNNNGYYDNYCKYIDYIVQNSSCTFIKSAGNNGPSTQPNISAPGCGMNVITVGSISKNQKVSYFSSWYTSNNYLYKPDMVAPGERISNIPNLSGSNSGTSFAAPMVTGVVALLMEEFPALKTNPSLVKAALQNGCNELPSQTNYFDQQCGYGLVNYQNARAYLNNSQYTTFNIPSSGVNGNIVASRNVTIPANAKIDINATWTINSTNVTPNNTSTTPSYTKCYLKLYDTQSSSYVKTEASNSNAFFLGYENQSSSNKQYRIDVVINGNKATGGPESGSLVYNLTYHNHNYTYSWINYTQHNAVCSCGNIYTEYHVVIEGPLPPGQQYATCIVCGGPASIGIVPINKNNLPRTLNGSYILPNGVIVLNENDIDDYFDESLVFIYPKSITQHINVLPLSFLRKEETNIWLKKIAD